MTQIDNVTETLYAHFGDILNLVKTQEMTQLNNSLSKHQ